MTAKDLAGKTFLVTGATDGLGKAAALDFARRGAAVTIVGRSREKSERVVAELAAGSGASVELLLGDLSTLADVRRVAAEFKARHDRLDALVNNAGAIFAKRETTADGLERTFALNHLAYFLLTTELLDLLRRTPGSRVVSTSSGAHFTGRIDFDDIARRERGYSGWRAYGDSKLANILFTRELARRLGEGHAVNCFHPGWVNSGFALNNEGLMAKIVGGVASVFARPPAKGAETAIWLATSPEAAKLSGGYFMDLKAARTTALARDDALAARLWEFSERLVAPPA